MAIDLERRQQPHWLYRMFDEDGRLLYIGQTSNPTQRLAWWTSSAKTYEPYRWAAKVARVSWREYPNWVTVCAAEREAIRAERPAHNRQHNILTVVPA